ncbi:MAG: bifunctional adenosylcobinamide kinase/adenosylcobinamide-phosphate guanylyltransferase [Eubacteriaceae bacterium]|jgi:adenosyl cobinamide kinase/adenosyl cobinamide phosphate guanylyltransferase|nr:bifunctional adenosylcobinamide kinase/adenosylcobinamide-phosphate guanylyltransferase [Eubacteriaceae bacterium]
MEFLYVGGNNNGMRERAEEVAKLSGDVFEVPLCYISTLSPQDYEESTTQNMREKHYASRGFKIEKCDSNICSLLDRVDTRSIFIIDSITSLLRNEMFGTDEAGGRYGESGGDSFDVLATGRVIEDLQTFAQNVRSTLYIGHYIFSGTGRRMDNSGVLDRSRDHVEYFRKGLALVERGLASRCDRVEEFSYGMRYRFK